MCWKHPHNEGWVRVAPQRLECIHHYGCCGRWSRDQYKTISTGNGTSVEGSVFRGESAFFIPEMVRNYVSRYMCHNGNMKLRKGDFDISFLYGRFIVKIYLQRTRK